MSTAQVRRPLFQFLGFVGWLSVCFAAAAIGARASIQAAGFYQALDRPTWGPPAWLFGPVWTVLYTLMAISAWMVWRRRGFREASAALGLFLVQLAANALWSWLFFSWRMGAAAFVEILILAVLIIATMAAFARVDRWAALLLAPYLAWVGFASVLAFRLWRFNPEILG